MGLLKGIKGRFVKVEETTTFADGRWDNPFELLRQKWHEVPGAQADRVDTENLLALSEQDLLQVWEEERCKATMGEAFSIRGWYHTIYKDVLRDKKVLDVGSGLGLDGITFAQHGARMTFADIVESNLTILERICRMLNIADVTFVYVEDIGSFTTLPADYDVVWCQGSLINAPLSVIRGEASELLRHLPVGGRWIELAYPRERWEREGRVPFDRWGGCTDGPGTPWMEWYDLGKIRERLSPAEFDVVLSMNFHNDDFNWFDLIRRS
jgi:hypothetical protein